MNYIYVDNFRGFKDTLIPIYNLNFFVGENSTGKTSILNLINLLMSHRFWLTQSFNNNEVHFGHFDDIVSISSNDRSYFTIGCIEKIKEDEGYIQAFLMTFRNNEGIPQLTNLTLNTKNQQLEIKYGKKSICYKLLDLITTSELDYFKERIFKEWKSAHHVEGAGFKKLGKEEGCFGDLFFTVFVILEKSSARQSQKKEIIINQSSFNMLPFTRNFLVWFAPIRTRPKRTYDEYSYEFSPEGGHTPYLIKKILSKKEGRASKFREFMYKTGTSSGLFESIHIRPFGKGATAPFELDIMLNKKHLNINNVGYGVSQSLPLFVETFARSSGTLFAIQQPEVHLHPRAQATLGDIFFDLSVKEKKRFLIETHSDFLIDRFRLNCKKRKNKGVNAQILFFEKNKEGNRVSQIEISKDGKLPLDQPRGYRDFFVRENMNLLGL